MLSLLLEGNLPSLYFRVFDSYENPALPFQREERGERRLYLGFEHQ